MRFWLNINQKKSLEWGLSINEAVVFAAIRECQEWTKEIIYENRTFHFMSRNMLSKEIPITGFKPDTVYRYLKKLEEKGLIEWKKDFKKDLIRLTEKGCQWNSVEELGQPSEGSDLNPSMRTAIRKYSDNHPKILGQPSEKNSDSHPTYTNSNIDNNSIDNNSIDNNSCREKNFPDAPSEKKESIKDPKKKQSPLQVKYKTEISEIIEYLNDATGRNLSTESSATEHIAARIEKDGATMEEMKQVIDIKTREWIDSEKMKKCLRPETLFNKTKYTKYREEYQESEKILEALKSSQNEVSKFIASKNLLFVWSGDEIKALKSICHKLKAVMKEKGESLTMANLNTILMDLLMKLDDYHLKNFSLKMIDNNFNKVINAAKNNKDAEWNAWVASFK